MTLDQQSATLIAVIEQRFPKLGTEVTDAAEARRILAEKPAAPAPAPDVHRVHEQHIPGPEGAPPVRVRVYWPGPPSPPAQPGPPAPDTDGRPAIVFFHGGGFVICSLDTHGAICRELAVGVDAVVFSVDYRLAPETRWPGAAEDSFAATAWVADHAAELGVDPSRIAVAGDSAGGNLAAAVALIARDRSGPALAAQLLVYPMLDTDFGTESYVANAHGYNVTIDHLRWYWQQYLGDHDGSDPTAAPLRAGDLAGLPPTYIVAAEHCPLRTENERYAQRLTAAGVPTTLVTYPGVAHGFFTLAHALDTGRRADDETFAAMREMLHG